MAFSSPYFIGSTAPAFASASCVQIVRYKNVPQDTDSLQWLRALNATCTFDGGPEFGPRPLSLFVSDLGGDEVDHFGIRFFRVSFVVVLCDRLVLRACGFAQALQHVRMIDELDDGWNRLALWTGEVPERTQSDDLYLEHGLA